jgi:hypothetical protein
MESVGGIKTADDLFISCVKQDTMGNMTAMGTALNEIAKIVLCPGLAWHMQNNGRSRAVPCAGLAWHMQNKSWSRARPNCIASGGASFNVSTFTP